MLYMSISWAYARPEYKFVKRDFRSPGSWLNGAGGHATPPDPGPGQADPRSSPSDIMKPDLVGGRSSRGLSSQSGTSTEAGARAGCLESRRRGTGQRRSRAGGGSATREVKPGTRAMVQGPPTTPNESAVLRYGRLPDRSVPYCRRPFSGLYRQRLSALDERSARMGRCAKRECPSPSRQSHGRGSRVLASGTSDLLCRGRRHLSATPGHRIGKSAYTDRTRGNLLPTTARSASTSRRNRNSLAGRPPVSVATSPVSSTRSC